EKHLYGASVQGIQNFIFQTSKLREIVGASQLVDNICTSEFRSFCSKQGHRLVNENQIMSAAGNIRYLVDHEACQKIVRNFPKHISNYALGITISQAVVKCTDNLRHDLNELEKRLKSQKNKAGMPIDIGYMGLGRARRTGGVASERKYGEFIDRATSIKIEKSGKDALKLFKDFSGKDIGINAVPFEMEDLTSERENGWVAIVHADGNGLGLLLQNLTKKLKENEAVQQVYSNFSKKLEQATKEAAQIAFKTVLNEETQNEIDAGAFHYPIRPIILGGDDLTIIIRADLAFNFTKAYLKAFEETTSKHFATMKIEGFSKGLTACAGIAYIKSSHPFHYGVHLAESLTAAAKRNAKAINSTRAPSSLYFYKVQASYIDDLESMKSRTHFANTSKVSFDYGPYLITEHIEKQAHVKDLEKYLAVIHEEIKNGNPSISKIRQWAAELHKDKAKADFMLNRIKMVNPHLYAALDLGAIQLEQEAADTSSKTMINDLIVLSSF
ncbi:MAG: hypothetical protein AAGJ18_27860, partial [Bacteroidota bacterium]